MSFSGDLEYLSIIDVIQLMHTTRKTGTLKIDGRKGQISLAFNDGFVIGARHYQQGARIGSILVEAGVINQEALEKALKIQADAADERKPLIATLLENGLADRDAAYRGLEALIEVNIVEILTWKKGHFELEIDGINVCDEFRYFPEKMNEHLTLSTEHVLMDALRIYDEKIRDGLITDEDISAYDQHEAETRPEETETISADDLGLGDISAIKRKIPGVYEGLREQGPLSLHKKQIAELSPQLPDIALIELASFLDHLPAKSASADSAPSFTMIFYSCDRLISYCISAACRQAGINVFGSNDANDLGAIIDQFVAKKQPPMLLFDTPNETETDFSALKIAELRQQSKAKHPDLCVAQLASPHDYNFWMQTFQAGTRTIFPRPACATSEGFVKETKNFLEALPPFITSARDNTGDGVTDTPKQAAATLPIKGNTEESLTDTLRQGTATLRNLNSVPEAAMALLKVVSGLFDRSVTLVVRDNELIAEKGIGINMPKEEGPGKNLGFKIPAEDGSIFRFMLDKGYIFYGKSEDRILQAYLHKAIGTPLHSNILLLPLKLGKQIVSITYADFGQSEVSDVSTDVLETFADQAGIALENSMHRNRIEKAAA